MNFYESLKSAEMALTEAVVPMSKRQREMVSTMSRAGWDVDIRDGSEVVMKKGPTARAQIDGQGYVTTLSESDEFNFELEGDLLAEAVANASQLKPTDSVSSELAQSKNPLRTLERNLRIKYGITGAMVGIVGALILTSAGILPLVASFLPIVPLSSYLGQKLGKIRAPAVAQKAMNELNLVLDRLQANVELRDRYFTEAKRIREETIGMESYLDSYASQVKNATEKQAEIGLQLRDVLAKHGSTLKTIEAFSGSELDELDTLSKAAQRGLVTNVAGSTKMFGRRAKLPV